MTARYETKVHATSRDATYGIPVTVYAENMKDAISRAIEIGWLGEAHRAAVSVLRVEEVSDGNE